MTITPSVVISDPSLVNGYTVTTPPSGGWLVQAKPAPGSQDISPAEQAIRARWQQNGDHPQEAMALVDWLREQGLEVLPPKTRAAGKNDEPYLRWFGVSFSNRKVSGYVNTSSLTINGASKVAVVEHLEAANLRKNGEAAHFFLPDVEACKVAVKTLLAS